MLRAFNDVDPQSLIAKGYTKAELGKALFDARIESIHRVKNRYAD